MPDVIEIPARRGVAHRLQSGQHIRIINTHGSQVVDTWAYDASDSSVYMSMDATRATNQSMRVDVGTVLYSHDRRAMLTVTEDTSPGVHDMLMAACDRYRYKLLGCTEYHDNCSDNLCAAMEDLDVMVAFTPSPLNLFMNIPWTAEGALSYQAPTTAPGDAITLRAEMDLIIAFSACPQDILPVNGTTGTPVEAHFEILV